MELVRQGWTVFNDALVVGANGAWKGTNDLVVEKLAINPRYAFKMKQFIVANVINDSANIYFNHIGMHPREAEPPHPSPPRVE